MSLENLRRIGQFKAHPPDADEIDRPGHHATLLQSLPLTIGAEPKRVVVLDDLRHQRNVADYIGDDIDDVRMRRRAMMRSS